MLVKCEVEEIMLEGDYGEVPSVMATCPYCNYSTESYGTSEDSIKRCLVLLRQECFCQNKKGRFYVKANDLL